jgi:hypothetical protein
MNPTSEIRDYHKGAVMTSEWSIDCRRRPLPPGCRYVHASEVPRLGGIGGERARVILKAHPRVKWFVVWEGGKL